MRIFIAFIAAALLAPAADAAGLKALANSPFGDLGQVSAEQQVPAPGPQKEVVENGLEGTYISDKSYTDMRLLTIDMMAKEAELSNAGMKIISSEKVKSGILEYFFVIKYEIPIAARTKIFTSAPLLSAPEAEMALENARKVLGELVPPVAVLESTTNANNSFTIKYYAQKPINIVEYKAPAISFRKDKSLPDLEAGLKAALQNAGARVLYASWRPELAWTYRNVDRLTLAYVGDNVITNTSVCMYPPYAQPYVLASKADAAAINENFCRNSDWAVFEFNVSR